MNFIVSLLLSVIWNPSLCPVPCYLDVFLANTLIAHITILDVCNHRHCILFPDFQSGIILQVACSGHGKNGSLSVLHQSIRPDLITEVGIPMITGWQSLTSNVSYIKSIVCWGILQVIPSIWTLRSMCKRWMMEELF